MKQIESWCDISALAALRIILKEVFVPKYSAGHLLIMKIAICSILENRKDTLGLFSSKMIEIVKSNWKFATHDQLIVYHSLQKFIPSLPDFDQ